MIMCSFSSLPEYMQNESVKKYYNILNKKKISLFLKRIFDIVFSLLLIIILLPLFIIISLIIKIDSKGSIIFKQIRVTQYGRKFKIYKFRTMVANAESVGSQVTIDNDSRITRVGKIIRKCRLDEIPQLFNIIKGDMTFVGTRPEVPKYVDRYTDEMLATLLLKAGVTSEASIMYKDEDKLLKDAIDVDKVYIEEVLPQKMKYNLKSIKNFNFLGDIYIMIKTIIAVI